MKLTCVIRYQIDPFQREAFKEYAKKLGTHHSRCGGHLVGYFLPYEGTNDVAWALIALIVWPHMKRTEPAWGRISKGRANFRWPTPSSSFFGKKRSFVEVVDGTFGIPVLTAVR